MRTRIHSVETTHTITDGPTWRFPARGFQTAATHQVRAATIRHQHGREPDAVLYGWPEGTPDFVITHTVPRTEAPAWLATLIDQQETP